MADWMDVAIDAGLKLADRAVNKIFSPKKADPEPMLMSLGLAVGYYYNFLDVVAQQLSVGSITLNDKANPKPGEGNETEFDLDATKIQIIVPAKLEVSSFQLCVADFEQSLKGSVLLKAQKRYYGINYRISDLGSTKLLTIIDLAPPAMALKRYYEDVAGVKTYSGDNDARWRELQKAELAAFAETLKRLQERGYGILANKLDIVYRG
jgi:hypothetical protein